MGGYASNSKYGMVGGMRTVAQMLAYEVPMVFALLGIIMITGSLKMSAIVDAQANVWFIFLQPLAFLIFLITALVESNRPPFNIVEGESEIVAGHMVEYSGMSFAMFYLAEYANMILISTMASLMFLGGWDAPLNSIVFNWVPGWIWLGLKTFVVVSMFIWARASFPRYRYDQIMRLGWKVFIPLTLVYLVFVAAWIQTSWNIWK